MGPLHYFRGIEINPFDGGLFLSQQKYVHDLLSRILMLESNYIATPQVLKEKPASSDDTPIDATNFKSIVGTLQYLTFTRPDIVHAIN